MIHLHQELERISEVAFFSSLGQPLAEEFAAKLQPELPFLHYMQLPDVQETFVQPTLPEWIKLQSAVRWLPSSPTEPDPFYPAMSADPQLLDIRKQIYQAVLRQTRTARPDTLKCRPHDFTTAARQAAGYAYRQYAMERYYDLGSSWQRVIQLYEAGHWPAGYAKDTLVWI
ncbi:hypothetical protein [Paenibacillus dauci]|uniref:hypothetical protein n=1 Tax=Paenibacillus dauci TaxID=1567106 RepID=UPI0006194DBD|nr:hypothetical protein [Paenibacillus dauci]